MAKLSVSQVPTSLLNLGRIICILRVTGAELRRFVATALNADEAYFFIWPLTKPS